MSQDFNGFQVALVDFTKQFLFSVSEPLILLHHNDSDGLASGAILRSAFDRQGIPYRAFCLEKPYPAVLRHLFEDPLLPTTSAFVFADFASGMLPIISELAGAQRKIFILDHHFLDMVDSPRFHVLNPLRFGFQGNLDACASAVCYLFAKQLSRFNTDLSQLGVLGAIGDGQLLRNGSFGGLNALVFDEANRLGLVRSQNNEMYFTQHELSGSQLCAYVDALGSIGYLDGGPDIALKGLAEGFDIRYQNRALELLDRFRNSLHDFLSSIALSQSPNIQWFTLDDSFDRMGVKTVGLVCEALRTNPNIDQRKYICGFQKIPSLVPGIGEFNFGEYKVSMRLPSSMSQGLHKGEVLPLTDLMPLAASQVEGFSDAAHPHAAAVTIAQERQAEFLGKMESILSAIH